MSFTIKKLGTVAYQKGLEIQNATHQKVAQGDTDTLLLCEHHHVYTFGKSAKKDNLLITPGFLRQIGAEVHQTDRGGDITYHGPGQLVGYPIINLRKHGIGVKKYIETLESSLIKALKKYTIEAYQIDGLTGIWVGTENEIKRKIGAIGVRIKDGTSMHGFALNINTDLAYFNHIVPCGITDKTVTSVEKEVGEVSFDEFSDAFISCFQSEWSKSLTL